MNAIATVQPLLADNDWNHMGGGSWVFMGLGMIIFWGLVIFGVVWLVRTLTADHRAAAEKGAAEPSAVEVLDRKLAEGSIGVDDYRERRALLTERSKEG
jgi:putative membrane protein